MLCEECGERDATVIVTTVINGETTTRNLCRECVKKYQKGGDISTLLAAILSSMYKAKESGGKACPRCGMTLAEFNSGGMFGCSGCYSAFREELDPMLNRIQGRMQHAGRKPHMDTEAQAKAEKITRIRRAMEAAVSEEAFEEAARLRDELKALTAPESVSDGRGADGDERE